MLFFKTTFFFLAFWIVSRSLAVETPHALFQRLTGIPLLKSDPRWNEIRKLLDQGKQLEASHIATSESAFYNLTVRNWAAPLSNKEGSPYVPLSDFETMVVGVVRDGIDARQLLTGNFRYQGEKSLQLPEPSASNAEHYIALEKQAEDLSKVLVRSEPQWDFIEEPAGLLTTRRWATEHLIGGTNRRSTQFALQVFLCASIEEWKTVGLDDGRVRQDVTRFPSGDPKHYQNDCRSCHAPLDALTGAFAHIDFRSGELLFGKNWIAPKMVQNSHVYPPGFETFDASWINLLSQNEAFGWRGRTEGIGIKAFGELLANSKAYSRCLVEKVFEKVCRRELTATESQAFLESARVEFENDGYHLKNLFERIAIDPICTQRGNHG